MSQTPYNPANKGKKFNQDAQPIFREITENDRKDADKKIMNLIADAHKKLFEEEN